MQSFAPKRVKLAHHDRLKIVEVVVSYYLDKWDYTWLSQLSSVKFAELISKFLVAVKLEVRHGHW